MAPRRVLLAGLLGAVVGCARSAPPPEPAGPPQRVEAAHLPNAYRIHPKVISGGLPEGEAAFRELRDLGIKTIISVDGAKPDVELANKYGMRYVHVPHGYDGISEQRARELAKAVRDLPGPIYIHCHHGRHRSPTAAAVACVGAGLLPAEAAPAVLQAAGTGKNYRGLHHAAQTAKRFDDALLDALQAEFPAQARIPPLAEAMVELDKTFEHMRHIEAAGWSVPEDHPDLDPAHESLLLVEHFTEMLRTEEVQQQPAQFLEWLRASEHAAQQLHNLLEQGDADPAQRATTLLARIHGLCSECHQQYRDVPLYEREP